MNNCCSQWFYYENAAILKVDHMIWDAFRNSKGILFMTKSKGHSLH